MNDTPTLLVAEDHQEELELLENAFSKAKLGVNVRQDSNGERALTYPQAVPPYGDRAQFPMHVLILLDIRLPPRSGFEVLSGIKRESDPREMPVIIFSSSQDPNDVDRIYKVGANAYNRGRYGL